MNNNIQLSSSVQEGGVQANEGPRTSLSPFPQILSYFGSSCVKQRIITVQLHRAFLFPFFPFEKLYYNCHLIDL